MRSVLVMLGPAIVSLSCSTAERPNHDVAHKNAPESSSIAVLERQEGRASYVAQALNGRKTASGVVFDGATMVAAHPTYPFGTMVRVTEVERGRSVEVQIIDRGPAAVARQEGVIVDLSRAAAEALGIIRQGRAAVRLEVLRWGSGEISTGK
jgi:rare lipoprotein A